MTVELTKEDIIDIFCGLTIYESCPYYKSLLKRGFGTSEYENWGWNYGANKICWNKKAKIWKKYSETQLWNMYNGLKSYNK